MRKILESGEKLKRNMVAIICLSLTLYFSYHLIAGPRGYFKLKTLEYEIAKTETELEALVAEREAIHKKVVMMRPGSIDRDLLEERIRDTLGYTSKEEYILLQDRS
ncbi:MAG: septum formation initiator family protein [Pseudomonadota bacterium]